MSHFMTACCGANVATMMFAPTQEIFTVALVALFVCGGSAVYWHHLEKK